MHTEKLWKKKHGKVKRIKGNCRIQHFYFYKNPIESFYYHRHINLKFNKGNLKEIIVIMRLNFSYS